MSELDRQLFTCLEPVRAPESVWYRVEAELFPAPVPPRSLLRPALAVLLAIFLCAATWTVGQRSAAEHQAAVPSAKARSKPPSVREDSRHNCIVCHG